MLQKSVGFDAKVNVCLAPEFTITPGEYPVYDPASYDWMCSDLKRDQIYRGALKRLVRGRVVLDIGTGGQLHWALASLEAGATKVFAIEALDEAYQDADALIRKLGLEDRLVLFKGLSMEVNLPEKVDVCVSEIIGNIASAEGAVHTLTDAYYRFLKPNGNMIPFRCETRIAACMLPNALHARPGISWVGLPYLQQIFGSVGHPFDVRVSLVNVSEECLLSKPQTFETLDFAGPPALTEGGELTVEIDRSGRLDGFLLWIRLWCDQAGDFVETLTGATLSPCAWCPVFFPVFYPGLPVQRGDRIDARCSTSLSDDWVHPDYAIRGAARVKNRPALEFDYLSTHHGRSFRGNEFYRALFP